MATYLELFDLKNNNDFQHKIQVAVVVKAQSLLDAAIPTADEVSWANTALSNPTTMATKIMYYAFAANKDATTAQILAASDSDIQSNVDSAADALIAGGVTS